MIYRVKSREYDLNQMLTISEVDYERARHLERILNAKHPFVKTPVYLDHQAFHRNGERLLNKPLNRAIGSALLAKDAIKANAPTLPKQPSFKFNRISRSSKPQPETTPNLSPVIPWQEKKPLLKSIRSLGARAIEAAKPKENNRLRKAFLATGLGLAAVAGLAPSSYESVKPEPTVALPAPEKAPLPASAQMNAPEIPQSPFTINESFHVEAPSTQATVATTSVVIKKGGGLWTAVRTQSGHQVTNQQIANVVQYEAERRDGNPNLVYAGEVISFPTSLINSKPKSFSPFTKL
jgi:hypothetical protein